MTFTASNGAIVHNPTKGGIAVGNSLILRDNESTALREFFQHERDEELGRWRWPERPHYVAYARGADSVRIIDERTGRAQEFDRNGESTWVMEDAANAYFKAHPERKPWEDAKPGDVWVIEVEGTESYAVHVVAEFFGAVSFQTPTGRKVNMNNSAFTGFRKIWPEDAS